ncbi:hypothetical protein [Amycolatopsis sp. FDAARGOS 1241]|uniref:hypothetical protein n=1 Tax=Amycolatopsis sp. FDAARGOS 1241 TaxID=2778070 RepID=UPI00195072A6|nr:hypothetical protein [Amycolatopsis sp. FDAARGOS 1241]QRP47857.1 hypothetical protein I6J71_08060 [Amycolatopsis sp. FDAARGOS 1241]
MDAPESHVMLTEAPMASAPKPRGCAGTRRRGSAAYQRLVNAQTASAAVDPEVLGKLRQISERMAQRRMHFRGVPA